MTLILLVVGGYLLFHGAIGEGDPRHALAGAFLMGVCFGHWGWL